MLTYHCSNKTKTIEIADIGGEGGQKLENLADIICERSLTNTLKIRAFKAIIKLICGGELIDEYKNICGK